MISLYVSPECLLVTFLKRHFLIRDEKSHHDFRMNFKTVDNLRINLWCHVTIHYEAIVIMTSQWYEMQLNDMRSTAMV